MDTANNITSIDQQLPDQKYLHSLHSKLTLLLDSLHSILLLPPTTPYPHLLSLFNTTIAKYSSLTNDLQDVRLKQTVMVPGMIDPKEPEFMPMVMLRTKLIPEVQDHQAKIISSYSPTTTSTTVTTTISKNIHHANDTHALKAILKDLEIQIEKRQIMIQNAIEIVSDLKGEMVDEGLHGRKKGKEGVLEGKQVEAKKESDTLNELLRFTYRGPQPITSNLATT